MVKGAQSKLDTPWSGVFCLEGAWDEEDLEDRSSVLPVLDTLQRLRSIDYIHRDIGTRAELEHYVRRWIDEDLDYQLLFLAFHGSVDRGGVRSLYLSRDTDGAVTLDQLTGLLAGKLKGCIAHLGSCSVVDVTDPALRTFLDRTQAEAVMGYDRDVDWVDSAAWELILFGTLARYKQLGSALRTLKAERYRSLRKSVGFHVIPRSGRRLSNE